MAPSVLLGPIFIDRKNVGAGLRPAPTIGCVSSLLLIVATLGFGFDFSS